MNFETIQNMIAGLIRTLLAPVVLYLTANGYLGESESVQLVAIAASLVVAVAWSFISKIFAAQKVDEALAAPAGTTRETLAKIIARK